MLISRVLSIRESVTKIIFRDISVEDADNGDIGERYSHDTIFSRIGDDRKTGNFHKWEVRYATNDTNCEFCQVCGKFLNHIIPPNFDGKGYTPIHYACGAPEVIPTNEVVRRMNQMINNPNHKINDFIIKSYANENNYNGLIFEATSPFDATDCYGLKNNPYTVVVSGPATQDEDTIKIYQDNTEYTINKKNGKWGSKKFKEFEDSEKEEYEKLKENCGLEKTFVLYL